MWTGCSASKWLPQKQSTTINTDVQFSSGFAVNLLWWKKQTKAQQSADLSLKTPWKLVFISYSAYPFTFSPLAIMEQNQLFAKIYWKAAVKPSTPASSHSNSTYTVWTEAVSTPEQWGSSTHRGKQKANIVQVRVCVREVDFQQEFSGYSHQCFSWRTDPPNCSISAL